MLNIEQVEKILPQRYPFLLIDRVESLSKERVIALKNVTINEPFFSGHFPGRPIMPGVLIIEAIAQASIILFSGSSDLEVNQKMSYYIGSVKIRFLNPVFPGDQLRITVEPLKMLSSSAIVSVKAMVLDKEIAKGEISLSVKHE